MYKGPGVNPVNDKLGLQIALIAGGLATVEIGLPGITLQDRLQFVLGLDPDNVVPGDQVVNLTARFAISSAGHIVNATTNTTGYMLLVVWHNTK